jgi:hypothetical protein
MSVDEEKLVGLFSDIRRKGGFKYRSTGPRSLSNIVANHFGEKSETQLLVNGTRIFTTRLNVATRFSLFAKVANWKLSACESSRNVLQKFGETDSGLKIRLNCTLEFGIPNSFGLALGVNENEGLVYVYHKSEPEVMSEVWKIEELENAWIEKKSNFAIVEFIVDRQGQSEIASPSRLTYFSQPKLDVPKLLKNRSLTLDHLLSFDGKTVREKGPLFKLDRSSLDTCYSVHNKHLL